MSRARIGSVDVELLVHPAKVRVDERTGGKVSLNCRNFSVCSVDLRVRDLGVLDLTVAVTSPTATLPMRLEVLGRTNRRSAATPNDVAFGVGTWAPGSRDGATDVTVEVDGLQGGSLIPMSHRYLTTMLDVTK